MLNIALQLFSFERSRKVLRLFKIVDLFVKDSGNLKLVFNRLDGARKTVTLRRILNEAESKIAFSEGYVQLSLSCVREEWIDRGVTGVIVHFSVSPSSEVWMRLTGLPITDAARNVSSVERAAANRGREMEMPTVVEITFETERQDPSELLKEMASFIGRNWAIIDAIEKFGTIDVGANWLFFQKSGYNPNTANIHIYFDPEVRRDWERTKKRHNASFDEAGTPTVHKTSVQLPAHSSSRRA